MGSNGSSPRIGLPTYVEQARWGAWEQPAALLATTYIEAVTRAGAVPVLLPPVELADGATVAVAALDGLLLTGGADIDPSCYGAPADVATTGLRPDRDRWETALLRAALDRDLPVLAICRGMQLLNVALGGTLHQHLPDVVGHEDHRPRPGTYGRVSVAVRPGSGLASILGAAVTVPCHHHQAVDRLGVGLEIAATAGDGTIEAVELTSAAFVLGVQWHPEQGDDPRLFDALGTAARSATTASR